jgi:hypothetical protein
MGNEAPDAIDQVLAEALARYSNAEPLAGLEDRVLCRVRTGGAQPPRWRWRWVCAVAAGAALGAILWMRTTPDHLRMPRTTPRPPEIARAPEATPTAKQPAPRARTPKRRQFPTPAPLTRDERALLAYVRIAPNEARDLHRRIDEPIRIDEIKIGPLQTEDSR